MRIQKLMILAAAAALLAACGADVGEAGTRLVVDEAVVTGEVLYVLPDVSQVPFTAHELEVLGIDESEAIPVRVEVFEDIAVAWFAPDGEARIGRDWIVALWRVQRTPVDGELAGSEAPTVSPSGTVSGEVDPTTIVDMGDTYEIELRPEVQNSAEMTIIEFWDRLGTPDEISMLEELYQHHPGC